MEKARIIPRLFVLLQIAPFQNLLLVLQGLGSNLWGMDYLHGTTVKALLSPDRTRRIDIVARNDGTFQFFEQMALSKTDGGGWHPGKESGFYETAAAAELAARAAYRL
jgi:hypothetical protein